ncbi:MAG: SIMPL domain-containing protein [Bacteroidales bacterium]|nr:SIMPL domain-containing protein [Bacteroidales bacterium]MDD3522391.1 SIMPL domain-containing protein [Bacteroidales bacterium]MDD4031095.1 SIMPL domain-containing protein [Bacteroidales bacterium]MDD4434579.1 SIMPL domain-containing protein [Bacteroidales bacterium]
MKTYRIEALIVATALVITGLLLKQGIDGFSGRDRTVNVKGLSEMEVPADKVTWPLVYKEIGNNLQDLYVRINRNNKTLVDYLISNGISEEEIGINAPEIIDMSAERYSTTPAPYRYNVTSVITVSSNKVDLVRKLIADQGELLKQGIAITGGEYRYNTVYSFTALNDIKPQMIEEATRNARAAAMKFAQDSGSKLGKIRNASQGQFTISDRDENTPYIKNVRVVTTVNYYLKD